MSAPCPSLSQGSCHGQPDLRALMLHAVLGNHKQCHAQLQIPAPQEQTSENKLVRQRRPHPPPEHPSRRAVLRPEFQCLHLPCILQAARSPLVFARPALDFLSSFSRLPGGTKPVVKTPLPSVHSGLTLQSASDIIQAAGKSAKPDVRGLGFWKPFSFCPMRCVMCEEAPLAGSQPCRARGPPHTWPRAPCLGLQGRLRRGACSSRLASPGSPAPPVCLLWVIR